jgi:hypothetical protein
MYNTMLFVVESKSFLFVSYATTACRCKYLIRFSLIISPRLESQFLILFSLTVTFIYLTYHVSLLLLICISFRIIDIQFTFDIPNRLLNLTDSIAHEFQKVEIQSVTHHTVVREASEHTDWCQDRENIRVKSRPAREFRARRFSGQRGRFGIIPEEL